MSATSRSLLKLDQALNRDGWAGTLNTLKAHAHRHRSVRSSDGTDTPSDRRNRNAVGPNRPNLKFQTEDMSLNVGDRVRRGPDWKWGRQDGGLAGTVTRVDPDGWVRVEWDKGGSNRYRTEKAGGVDLVKTRPRSDADQQLLKGVTVLVLSASDLSAGPYVGQKGRLVEDDKSVRPFKVEFHDGTVCWFNEGELQKVADEETARAVDVMQQAQTRPEVVSLWKCVDRAGVAYRNSTSMEDHATGNLGISKGSLITAIDRVGEDGNWLKVVHESGIKYLPIKKDGNVLFVDAEAQLKEPLRLTPCLQLCLCLVSAGLVASTVQPWIKSIELTGAAFIAPPRPPPPPPPSFCTICLETCLFPSDGDCDDGGPGSELLHADCPYGTDCMDCGPRGSTGTICFNHCVSEDSNWPVTVVNDGDCDDGGPSSRYDWCLYGTDCEDCGPRPKRMPPPLKPPPAPAVASPPLAPRPVRSPPASPPPLACTNTCIQLRMHDFEREYFSSTTFASDGDCDDAGPGSGSSICAYGTDCADCGPRDPGLKPSVNPDIFYGELRRPSWCASKERKNYLYLGLVSAVVLLFLLCCVFSTVFSAFQPEAILKRVECIEGHLFHVLQADIIRLISVDWLLSQPPDWIAVRRQVRRSPS